MLNQNASNGTAVLFVKGSQSSSWQRLQLTLVSYHIFSQSFRRSKLKRYEYHIRPKGSKHNLIFNQLICPSCIQRLGLVHRSPTSWPGVPTWNCSPHGYRPSNVSQDRIEKTCRWLHESEATNQIWPNWEKPEMRGNSIFLPSSINSLCGDWFHTSYYPPKKAFMMIHI